MPLSLFLASSPSGRPAVAIRRRAPRCLPVAGDVTVGGSIAKLWTAVVVTETVMISTDNTAAGSLIVVCSLCCVPDSGQSSPWFTNTWKHTLHDTLLDKWQIGVLALVPVPGICGRWTWTTIRKMSESSMR